MSKRVLAALLIALICLFSFCACKKGTEGTNGISSTAAASGDKSANEEGGNASATSTAPENGTDTTGTTAKNQSGEASIGNAENSETDGWEIQQGGNMIKGDITANVMRYTDASLGAGEELIKQLIEGGLDNPKVLAKEKTDNSVMYKVTGTRIGSKQAEFVKFQFVSEKGTGYLVTVMAMSEEALDNDISYILSHLAELAH